LRADDEAVRAQSAILNQPQTAIGFIHNRVFGADTLFIRTKNSVGAQNAQWPLGHIDG